MSIWKPAPPPKSPLARYRVLSPTASVRVSPLCLGAMNFGTAWKDFMGTCDQKTTEEILDFFYDQGGNFIDTANNYQDEESESWIGEWMKKRGVRDQMVIATKFTTDFQRATRDKNINANFTGNSTKSLITSVNASLKKLQTDYIDLVGTPFPSPYLIFLYPYIWTQNLANKWCSCMFTGGTLAPRFPR